MIQKQVLKLCSVLLIPTTAIILGLLFIGMHPENFLDASMIVMLTIAFLPVVLLNLFVFLSFVRFRNLILWILRFAYKIYFIYVLILVILTFQTLDRFAGWLPLALLTALLLIGYVIYSLYSLYDTGKAHLS